MTVIVNIMDPILKWPVNFCIAVTATTYVLSLLTGNVGQVDRLWTILPTIYTAYYALSPLWPQAAPSYFYPYTPESIQQSSVDSFSPRALLMFALVVRSFLSLI